MFHNSAIEKIDPFDVSKRSIEPTKNLLSPFLVVRPCERRSFKAYIQQTMGANEFFKRVIGYAENESFTSFLFFFVDNAIEIPIHYPKNIMKASSSEI